MREERHPGKMLEIAGLAAQIILENGAETYRVEDTVRRLCRSFGFPEAEVIALSTGVVISVSAGDNSQSAIRRVAKRRIHLARVNAVNDLSRRAAEGGMTMQETLEALRRINEITTAGLPAEALWAGLSAGCFALMFGGGALEFLVALCSGVLCQLCARAFRRAEFSLVLSSLFGGAICSSLTMAAFYLFRFTPTHVETTLAGSIMPLISGLMMTHAVRDSLRGDLLSGIARGFEALLVAAMVALGISLVLQFYLSSEASMMFAEPPAWPVACLTAGAGTLGFCTLLSVPKRAVAAVSLLGLAAYAGFLALRDMLGVSPLLALFIAAGSISLLGELLARRMQMIATVFLCVSLVPLVPGLSLYRTMRELLLARYADALALGVETLLAVGAIALGAAFGSLMILRPERIQ